MLLTVVWEGLTFPQGRIGEEPSLSASERRDWGGVTLDRNRLVIWR